MKILFVQPTADKRGHYGFYTVNLCQEFARQGHEVTLFTNKVFPERYLDEKPKFEIVEHLGGRYAFESQDEKKRLVPFYFAFGYVRNSYRIVAAALRYAKDKHFDVIQLLDAEYSALSIALKLHGRGLPPVVLLIQGANFSFAKYPGNFVLRCYKPVQRTILKSRLGKEIRSLATLGEFHREELQKQFQLPKSFPIKVIHDGADGPKNPPSQKEARERLGLPTEGPLFLFFGMLRKDKGIEFLFEAFSMLQETPARLVVAGSLFDYSEEQIRAMLQRLGIENRVILRLGYVSDAQVPLFFFAADAVVFPYRKIYTGGSGPLLKEAAVFRTPIIANDVSEMGKLVRERGIGLLAEPENPSSLAAQMKRRLEMKPHEVQTLVENASQAANSWKSMAQEYVALYREASGSADLPAESAAISPQKKNKL